MFGDEKCCAQPVIFYKKCWLCATIYVIITDSSIIVKNYLISLLDKEYKYCEINRCLIGSTPKGLQYMQFQVIGSSRWSCYYGLELISREDLISIQNTLLQNSIVVVKQKN